MHVGLSNARNLGHWHSVLFCAIFEKVSSGVPGNLLARRAIGLADTIETAASLGSGVKYL